MLVQAREALSAHVVRTDDAPRFTRGAFGLVRPREMRWNGPVPYRAGPALASLSGDKSCGAVASGLRCLDHGRACVRSREKRWKRTTLPDGHGGCDPFLSAKTLCCTKLSRRR